VTTDPQVRTLDLPLRGREVSVEVWVDGADSGSSGAVLLHHGFARGPGVLEVMAATLVATGRTVVRPWIRSFGRARGMTDPDHVTEVARASVALVPEATQWVVVGHSAGGAVAAFGAASLVEQSHASISGLVLVDPNESTVPMLKPGATRVAEHATSSVVRVVAAEPGRCNRQGKGPRDVAAAAPGALMLRVAGGTHCEIEGEAADIVCRRLCGGRSDPTRTDLVHGLVVGSCDALERGESGWGSASEVVASGLVAGTLIDLAGPGQA
jgi:pimeloyl-ACP methyl ester carboxylesterase